MSYLFYHEMKKKGQKRKVEMFLMPEDMGYDIEGEYLEYLPESADIRTRDGYEPYKMILETHIHPPMRENGSMESQYFDGIKMYKHEPDGSRKSKHIVYWWHFSENASNKTIDRVRHICNIYYIWGWPPIEFGGEDGLTLKLFGGGIDLDIELNIPDKSIRNYIAHVLREFNSWHTRFFINDNDESIQAAIDSYNEYHGIKE